MEEKIKNLTPKRRKEVAKMMGITYMSLCNKMKGITKFSVAEKYYLENEIFSEQSRIERCVHFPESGYFLPDMLNQSQANS